MKTTPEVKELAQFLKLFNKESDRGSVLNAASLLDKKLSEILHSYLIDASAKKKLFEGFNAPLITFSSKITFSYCLGLINKEEYDELNFLRKIRNEFAHYWKIDFQNEDVKRITNKFPWYGPTELENDGNLRQRFDFAVVNLLVQLLYRSKYVGKYKLKRLNWGFSDD